jgi:hypothetical protein
LKSDLIGEAANLAFGYARRRMSRAAAWIVPLFL